MSAHAVPEAEPFLTDKERHESRDPLGEHACSRCPRRFSRPSYRALHRARDHADAPLSAQEQAAYERALADEEAWLADLRKHARAVMRVLPLVFFAFVVVALALNADVNPAFVVLVMPPSFVAVAVLYYLSYESG